MRFQPGLIQPAPDVAAAEVDWSTLDTYVIDEQTRSFAVLDGFINEVHN